jgi:hypothetical protein
MACSSTRRRLGTSPPRLGLSGCRRTYLTILELADHALIKMVTYVLLRPLRPELDGQDVEASSRKVDEQAIKKVPKSPKNINCSHCCVV